MRVLLAQLDGRYPNLALMRIAGHHLALGHSVELRQVRTVAAAQGEFWDHYDRVYASLIFTRSRPIALRLRETFPDVRTGGTGWDLGKPAADRASVERLGITAGPDYSLWPAFRASLGYTQRGCRLSCAFCDVPKAEGSINSTRTCWQIYRGEPWPRHLLLLDNDFFGSPPWRERISEMIKGCFRVSFNQGINVRTLSDEQAGAIASVDYRDDDFQRRRLYTAWDNAADERPLIRGLERLFAAGVDPDNVHVYMLIGYWHGPRLHADDLYRAKRLREMGCRPYPMPYVKTRELIGFQRWLVRGHDEKAGWEEYERAQYRPEKLKRHALPLFAE